MNKVLLIEDSKEIYQIVFQSIGSHIQVDWAPSLKKANEFLAKGTYELFLLDLELPDGNGIDYCSQLLVNHPLVPIFILTAHSELSEKVLGFSAGADDYITKPFSPIELKVRIESKLRKAQIQGNGMAHLLSWEELEISPERQEVYLKQADERSKRVDLTSLEFRILTYLAKHPHVVVERGKILDEIWGKDVHVYARSVDTHVSKLRKKLGTASSVIESVHGVGYKFVPTEQIRTLPTNH